MRVCMFMSETIELSITPWLPETAHVICQFWDLIMQAYVGVWCYHLSPGYEMPKLPIGEVHMYVHVMNIN